MAGRATRGGDLSNCGAEDAPQAEHVEVEHGSSETARAREQQEPQPEPELWQEPEDQPLPTHTEGLGQCVLPADALGPVTPQHKLPPREQWRGLYGKKYEDGPHYAWLEVDQELERNARARRTGGARASEAPWSEREAPASPASVIDSAAAVQDEPAEIIIIGGGPHALAALAALNDGSHLKDGTGACASVCAVSLSLSRPAG